MLLEIAAHLLPFGRESIFVSYAYMREYYWDTSDSYWQSLKSNVHSIRKLLISDSETQKYNLKTSLKAIERLIHKNLEPSPEMDDSWNVLAHVIAQSSTKTIVKPEDLERSFFEYRRFK